MKYVPFETIEEVEGFYSHPVYKNKKKYYVVGAKIINDKLNIILLDNNNEKEHVITAKQCLNEFTFINRPFGKVKE